MRLPLAFLGCNARMGGMEKTLTWAERYFEERRKDPEYDQGFRASLSCIDQIDSFYRALDERRCNMSLSMAELADRADLPLKVVEQFFSTEIPNQTLETLVAIATALDMRAAAIPVEAPLTVS